MAMWRYTRCTAFSDTPYNPLLLLYFAIKHVHMVGQVQLANFETGLESPRLYDVKDESGKTYYRMVPGTLARILQGGWSLDDVEFAWLRFGWNLWPERFQSFWLVDDHSLRLLPQVLDGFPIPNSCRKPCCNWMNQFFSNLDCLHTIFLDD